MTDIEKVARALCDVWDHDPQALSRAEWRKAACAAIAAMQPAPQWQGIESAPRDGSWIVLYDDRYKHSEHSYLIAQWHIPLNVWAGKKNTKGRFTLWDDATHWMPLPTPPAGGSDE